MARRVIGELLPPGDKSISHRALLFAALASGTGTIRGLNTGADVRSTREVLRQLGTTIDGGPSDLTVRGLEGRFRAPVQPLDCGNSGTTIRLIAGVLAGQTFESVLVGDASLSRRPMERVAIPLRAMGAEVVTENGCPPVRIRGGSLRGVTYESPVASAQVKSAVLLAGLFAGEPTTVIEPAASRDHTERMLAAMGASVARQARATTLAPGARLRALDMTVPGDASAAAFFVSAAAALPGSHLVVRNMGANPRRLGFLRVLERMGARVRSSAAREWCGEPVCDLEVEGGPLMGTTIEPEEVPSLVDEIPVLATVAAVAGSPTVIRGAAELRVKETDRLDAMASGLTRLGAHIREEADGLVVMGGGFSRGARVETHSDHRIAMSFAVAGLLCPEPVDIDDGESVAISDPEFFSTLERLAMS